MICAVYAVVVPPMQPGTAYAHADNGECIAFTGERARMIALCDDVRLYNNGLRPEVVVNTNDWHTTVHIEKAECFAHLGLVA